MKSSDFVCIFALALGLGVSLGVTYVVADAPSDWRVPEATVRFELDVNRRPTHASAGIFLQLPDSGLLPGPMPVTRVFTQGGRSLESYTLWHSPERNLAMIVESPGGSGEVLHVYVQPARQYRLWSPASGLTPSAILTTDPQRGSLSAAHDLARLGRVPPSVHHVNKPGVRRAPLSIAGDETGRPRPASFYMLAHLVSRDPGRTWIAPMAAVEHSEVRVNGQVLARRNRIDKWGGTGDWADIKEGPNRLDVFVGAPGSRPFMGQGIDGLIYLTWRTPNATMQELGGVRSEEVPMSGTSRMETRVLRSDEIMRSGGASLRRAVSRDGRPVALLRFGQPRVYWFGDEIPLLAYRFEALTDRQGPATTYTWHFPDGVTFEGNAVEWLFEGFREHKITLQASSDAGETRVTVPFFGFSSQQTSLNNQQDRTAYRQAMLNMATTYPTGHDTVANWDDAYWQNMLRTVELGRGTPLLRALFRDHGEVLEDKVDAEQIEALQDVFLDVVARVDQDEAFNWIRTFGEDVSQRRRDELVIRAAEVHMHYLRDYDSAERLLRTLRRPEMDAGQRFLRIRLGDLALLQGDLNLAIRYYADVQNFTRMRRSLDTRMGTPAAERGQPTGRPLIGGSMERTDADEWKLRALVDASASEEVRSLLQQELFLEAREVMRFWERELPMSKIAADFIVLETELYTAIRDPRRALSMLRAFCETVESSNFLPAAAPMLINLMIEVREPPDEIRRMGEMLEKRLEFHPVAAHLERLMYLIPSN